MRSFRPLLLTFGLLPFLASSCAKSPTGIIVRSSNRFQAQLVMAGTINPLYFYGVAFDDNGGDAQGPVAITGNTNIQNGVVGGDFRLLVLYNANTFQVWYRSNPTDPSTERVITGTDGLFVVTPTAGTNANGTSSINFTLNLDARLSDGTYIFPRGTDETQLASNNFDINAVTTNTIIRDPNDNRIKPVDAFGAQQVATPVQVQIVTRNTSITDATGAGNDENFGVDPSFTDPSLNTYVNFSQIDISQLQIAITRSTN